MRSILLKCSTVVILVAAISCGESTAPSLPPPPPPTPPTPASISLGAGALGFDALGATQTVTAAVLDTEGTAIVGAIVTWVSADTDVATVSQAGEVRAIGNGTTRLFATYSGLSSEVSVLVSQVAVAIGIAPDPLVSNQVGVDATAVANAFDRLGQAMTPQPSFTWRAADIRIARSSSNGRFTPMSRGATQVFAATQAGLEGVATLEVRPLDAPLAALRFDGLDDLVVIRNRAALNPTQEMTLEFWVRYASVGNGQWGVLKDDGGSQRQYALGITSGTRRLRAHVRTASAYHYFDGGTTVDAGSWIHVAQTYDGVFLRLYINGVLDGSLQVGQPMVTTGADLTLGNNPEGTGLDGWLDEVRLWSVARSETQIRSAMGTRLTGTEFGLLGYWPLDEGEGQIIFDVTTQRSDGFRGVSQGTDSWDPVWVFSTAVAGR